MITEDFLPIREAWQAEMVELYSWNMEDAVSAHEIWLKNRPADSIERGPICKWLAAQELKRLGEIFRQGHQEAILDALYVCSQNDLPAPKWCALAFLNASREVQHYRAKNWDDVFGEPHPKGTHLEAKRQKREKMSAVFLRVKEIIETEPGTPIDGCLFEKVGREFGIGGKTLTEQYYYAAKKLFAPKII